MESWSCLYAEVKGQTRREHQHTTDSQVDRQVDRQVRLRCHMIHPIGSIWLIDWSDQQWHQRSDKPPTGCLMCSTPVTRIILFSSSTAPNRPIRAQCGVRAVSSTWRQTATPEVSSSNIWQRPKVKPRSSSLTFTRALRPQRKEASWETSAQHQLTNQVNTRLRCHHRSQSDVTLLKRF